MEAGVASAGGKVTGASRLHLVALVLGMVATVPVLLLHATGGLALEGVVLRALLGAALPEGTAKLLALAVVLHRRGARDALASVAAGVAIGCGFALVETLVHVARLAHDADGALVVTVMRTVTTLPFHAALGAVMGAFFSGRGRTRALAWIAPLVLHTLYDVAVFDAGNDDPAALAFAHAVLVVTAAWGVALHARATQAGARVAAAAEESLRRAA